MRNIRTVIVDDEPMARMRVAKLLEKDPEIQMIAQCEDGIAALDTIKERKPDLIFLDVEMPGLNGFELVQRLPPESAPFIIFVTAYDQYAIQAFDVDAVDFLLKPYSDSRFTTSLTKAKRSLNLLSNTELTSRLLDLVRDHILVSSNYTEVFVIREKGRELRIPVDRAQYIKAKGNYLRIELKDEHYTFRGTLNTLEHELNPSRFLRIHRSFIINVGQVAGWRYTGNNEFIFTMANGTKIMSGRAYKKQIALAFTKQVDQSEPL